VIGKVYAIDPQPVDPTHTRWFGAGVLVTLGIMSQEFALLVAVPLLFLAPGKRRPVLLAGMLTMGLLTLAALLASTSPRLVWDALFGSIYYTTTDTLVMTLHLHGTPLVFVARILPVLLAAVISWWVVTHHRDRAAMPTTMVSLVAVSLSLRLVFEQNIFGYYYMALAVALVALDVLGGRIRSSLAAWLVMVSLVYLVGPSTTFVQLVRTPLGHDALQVLTPLVVLLSVAMMTFYLLRRAGMREAVSWLAVLCGCVLVWPSTRDPLSGGVSQLWWQILLVSTGVALAAYPLFEMLRTPHHVSHAEAESVLVVPSD